MTNWLYRRCLNDGSFYGWDDADPAADPEVQVRVLRAAAKAMGDPPSYVMARGGMRSKIARIIEAMEKGYVLEVDETPA